MVEGRSIVDSKKTTPSQGFSQGYLNHVCVVYRGLFWGILLLAGILYLPALTAPFVADDYLIFYNLQQKGAFGIAATPGTMFYRPLVSLNYYIDYRLWGLNPTLSHIVSLGWHLVCVGLVGLLCLKAFTLFPIANEVDEKGLVRGALLSMLVFALMPAHTEAVAWIASRADLIAAAFGLMSLFFLGCALQSPRSWGWQGLAWLAFAAGLFTKESVALLPLMVLVWLLIFHRERWRWALPFFGVLGIYLLLRTATVGGVGGYPEGMEVVRQPWRGIGHLGVYLLHMAFPAPLFGLGRELGSSLLFLGVGMGASLLLAQGRLRRTGYTKVYLLLGVWVILALAPVVFFKPSLWHPLNSRYTYWASVWVAIGAGLWLSSLQRSPLTVGGLTLMALSYGLGTLQTAWAWQTAGMIAHSTLQSLKTAPTSQPLILLSIPDHYRGAYIWRTSLTEALALYAPERTAPVYVLSRFTMRLRSDTEIVFQNGTATLSHPEDLFLNPEGSATYPNWQTVVVITPNRLRLTHPLDEGGMLMGYRQGRFILLHNKS